MADVQVSKTCGRNPMRVRLSPRPLFMKVKIRKFNKSDVKYLVEILKLNKQYQYPRIEGPKAMVRVSKCRSAIFLVAEYKKRPCGFIKAIYDGSRALIHLISIHPLYQNHGVGAALVRAVRKEISRRGASTISATSEKQSIGFWKKLGFKQLPICILLKEKI